MGFFIRRSRGIGGRRRRRNCCLIAVAVVTMSSSSNGIVIHLNHAGMSPSNARVTDCLSKHYTMEESLGGYQAAAEAQGRLKTVYQNAAKLIGAESEDEIALVESATVGWTRLFYSFCAAKDDEETSNNKTTRATSKNSDSHHDSNHKTNKNNYNKAKQVILISEAEYAANVVAACQWAQQRSNWSVLSIPSELLTSNSGQRRRRSSTGKVDINVLEQMLNGTYQCSDGSLLDPSSIALVCITHVPTNSGIVNPAKDIGNLIAKYNLANAKRTTTTKHTDSQHLPPILYLLDSCQSIGQLAVDVSEIQCHGLVATGRKYLRGPRGTGFLYIPTFLFHEILPHHVDHYGMPIQKVPPSNLLGQPVQEILDIVPLPNAKRFEFWESNIAGRLALGQALEEVLDRGIHTIQHCIQERVNVLYNALQAIPGVELYHQPECGICSFNIATRTRTTKKKKKQSTTDSGDDDYDDDDHEAMVIDTAAEWIKNKLWEVDDENGYRFSVSVAPATSTPLDSSRNNVSDLIRVSVSYTNTNEEIHWFCQRLSNILLEEETTKQLAASASAM